MRVELLPSSPGAPEERQYLHTFLIDDVVAIDAGSLGLHDEPETQACVRHVFLTHSHADHIATLPVFVENAYEERPDPVTVHGLPATIDALRSDVFNDRVWPDFERLAPPHAPFLRLATLQPGRPVEVEGLRVTPVAVDHVQPALGFLVDDGKSSIVISGDTGPTRDIWERAAARDDLRAAFVECSFPDEQAELARVSKHLTPRLLAEQVAGLGPDVVLLAYHLKARHRRAIAAQLAALGDPRLSVARCGVPLRF